MHFESRNGSSTKSHANHCKSAVTQNMGYVSCSPVPSATIIAHNDEHDHLPPKLGKIFQETLDSEQFERYPLRVQIQKRKRFKGMPARVVQ